MHCGSGGLEFGYPDRMAEPLECGDLSPLWSPREARPAKRGLRRGSGGVSIVGVLRPGGEEPRCETLVASARIELEFAM